MAVGRTAGTGARGQGWTRPDWEYPEYPDGSVVEVRVHGVGGATPQDMTGDLSPVLVGGDDKAGFWRAHDPVVGELGPTPPDRDPGADPPLHVREVLAWGGQTSGSVRHAFWVLLLPFALFNLAGRMHASDDAARHTLRRGAAHRAVCRVLALTMTLVVTGTVCGIGMDLLALQCGGFGAACLGGTEGAPVWLAPFRLFADDVLGRLGVAAVIAAAFVIGLWRAGRYATIQLEGTPPTGRPSAGDAEPTALTDPQFWNGAWPASRLRALHVSAGLAWVTGSLSLSAWAVLGDLDAGAGTRAAWLAAAVASAAVVLAAGVVVALPAIVVPRPDRRLGRALTLLRLGGMGLLGVVCGMTLLDGIAAGAPGWKVVGLVGGAGLVGWWLRRSRATPSSDTPEAVPAPDTRAFGPNWRLAVGGVLLGWGLTWPLVGVTGASASYAAPATLTSDGMAFGPFGASLFPGVFAGPYLWLLAVAVLQVVLVAALAVTSFERVPRRRADHGPLDTGPIAGNLSAVTIAVLSLFMTMAVGAGIHAAVLDLLGEHVPPREAVDFAGDVELVLPWWWTATAVAVVVVLLLTFLAVGVYAGWAGREADRPPHADVRANLRAAWGDVPLDDDGDARTADIGKAWLTSRLVRFVGEVLGVVGVVSVVVLGVLIVGPWVRRADWGAWGWVPTASLWLAVAVPLLAVRVIWSATRDRNQRRDIGRIWDVATFLPRVTHPFAPPCYAEAVVPNLRQRIEFLTGSPHDLRVLLGSHSQGTVVAAAAVAQLDPARRDRVALVTWGSPLAILYERFFRGTFTDAEGRTLFDVVEGRVHSWHHLFGMTEPFAFPFWTVDGVAEPDPAALARGWPLLTGLPSVAAVDGCAACAATDLSPPRRVELLVADPARWRRADGRTVPVRGHSTYDHHPDVEDHLHHLAGVLASRAGATMRPAVPE